RVRLVGMPRVVGELAAGIVLGPTVFGRISPAAQSWLVGRQGVVPAMLGAYTTVAVVLLLVVVGLEVDLDVLRRRGRSALFTALLGTVLPGICGVALGFLLPDSDLTDPARRVTFALLVGVALTISSLP